SERVRRIAGEPATRAQVVQRCRSRRDARLWPVEDQAPDSYWADPLTQGRWPPAHPARVGRRICRPPRRRGVRMSTRARANGEGSIFPYRNGFAAYVWVTQPNGQRQRKYIYGKTREQVHEKWLKLQQRARQGPMATSVPKLGEFLAYWLEEVIRPNLAP